MCIIHRIESMNYSLFTGVALIHDFVVVEDAIKPFFFIIIALPIKSERWVYTRLVFDYFSCQDLQLQFGYK